MTAVAERLVAGLLAAAEEQLAVLLGDMLDRGDGGDLVAAVAEGLLLRAPAGAPEIGLAGGDLDGERGLLGDDGGVGHVLCSSAARWVKCALVGGGVKVWAFRSRVRRAAMNGDRRRVSRVG